MEITDAKAVEGGQRVRLGEESHDALSEGNSNPVIAQPQIAPDPLILSPLGRLPQSRRPR